MSSVRVRHRKLAAVEQLVSVLARLSVVVSPPSAPSETSFFSQDEALSPVGVLPPATPDVKDVTDTAQSGTDESLAEALVEANERVFQYSREMRTAHEALREDMQLSLVRMQTTFTDAVSLVETQATRTLAALEAEKVYQTNRNAALLSRNRALRRQRQDAKGAIRVYVRVRPLTENVTEVDDTNGPVVRPARSLDPAAEGEDVVCAPALSDDRKKNAKESGRRPASRRAEEKRYAFDRMFGPESTQREVYAEISPLVTGALDGFSACIFAYGQTGSGKTYTMGGCLDSSVRDGEEKTGVNERALLELFDLVEAHSYGDATTSHETNKTPQQFTIGVEMREIYNERVRDLLVPDTKDASWKGGASGARMENSRSPKTATKAEEEDEFAATRVVVRDPAHALEVMREGASRRASAETALNERSSRSHSVVTVYCEGVDIASGAKISGRLHLVDLAGSERVSRSEAAGDRLKEAQHINKSLSALGDVVAALLEKRKHIPYRNSKLTRLLADSLGGDAKVALLAHLAPEHASTPETVSTLIFAQRCSRVEIGRAKANAISSKATAPPSAMHKAELEEARARASAAKYENEALRAEIASLKAWKEDASNASDTREPLSPLAKGNNTIGFASSLMPLRPPNSAAKAKRAIGRVAATASSTIMRES
jgi:kinesin family protein C2/C3